MGQPARASRTDCRLPDGHAPGGVPNGITPSGGRRGYVSAQSNAYVNPKTCQTLAGGGLSVHDATLTSGRIEHHIRGR
jgi:hypothetical protein